MNNHPSRPLKVFLCHAHEDRDFVHRLYADLTEDGVDVWLDKEKLLPGQDWKLEIQKAVHGSDAVVVCLSDKFNREGFNQHEVRLALDTAKQKPEGKIYIIPVRLEECSVPESLTQWHWVDLFEVNGYEMLMRALQQRALESDALPSFAKNRSARIRSQYSGATSKTRFPIEAKDGPKQPTGKMNPKAIVLVSSVGLIGVLALSLILMRLSQPFSAFPAATSQTPVVADTLPLPSATPLAIEITDAKGAVMRLVDAGSFIMGKSNSDFDEYPAHTVYLDSFYLDKYEVTNFSYQTCVQAGVCNPPISNRSKMSSNYFGNNDYGKHPVIYVDWNMARIYCEWRGSRLPTEAEWEKAARGVDGRIYPWGNEMDQTAANYSSHVGDTTTVGSYENPSPYDVYDMAGNVWEWVADWYDPTYYDTLEDPIANPLGPKSGQFRILRGGSWSDAEDLLHTYNRLKSKPNVVNLNIGIRCARDATP